MSEKEKKRIERELKISRPEWYRKKQEAQANRFKTLKLAYSTAKHLIAVVVVFIGAALFVIIAGVLLFLGLVKLFLSAV